MRRNIVKLLEAEKDITNVIVLTHNIDFIFIQSVLLPALRHFGHPSLTIFADSQCASESFQHQHMVLDYLGQRFRVVPVSMKPGFRFHPKAILLSGEKKGVLLVGSGNLTFGGWSENAEVWSRLDSDVNGTAPFSAFRDYLSHIVELVPLRSHLIEQVNSCFDEPWAQNMELPSGLLMRPFGKHCLIDQMKDVLDGKPVQSLLIHSPYFDEQGDALKKLNSVFNVKIQIAAQIKRSGLSVKTSQALDDVIDIKAVDFFHNADHDNLQRGAFIHAKWYAYEHEDSYTVFLGSANCSNAAITIPGNTGNAELMTFESLTKRDFVSYFTEDLSFLDVDPQLPSIESEFDPDESTLPTLQINAARLSEGCLLIAYTCSKEVALQELRLILDGKRYNYLHTEQGVIVANGVPMDCRMVGLQGTSDSKVIKSNLHWIDYEQLLSTTAHTRSLVDAVRMKVQSQSWSLGAWADIANVFLRNLQYKPKSIYKMESSEVKAIRTEYNQLYYTAEDVFLDSYENHLSSQFVLIFPASYDDRVKSLRQLLIRWFGYKDEAEQDSDVNPSGEEDNTVDDEVVDRPEPLPEQKSPKNTDSQVVRKVTDSDRRRALKILCMVTEQMVSETYLSERKPEAISVDIQFASVLLRSGLCEKWISEEEFFESTHKIWSALFFTSPYNASCGGLEHRHNTSNDQNEFKSKLVSPKLTAALTAWALAIPDEITSITQIKFSLAKSLSVARLPWLWYSNNREEVDQELQNVLVSSMSDKCNNIWEEVQKRRLKMARNGDALRILEEQLVCKTLVYFKEKILQKDINKGDLLWQGKNGICIATEDFSRAIKIKTNVLCLQNPKKQHEIISSLAIPVKALINESILDLTEDSSKVLLLMLESFEI